MSDISQGVENPIPAPLTVVAQLNSDVKIAVTASTNVPYKRLIEQLAEKTIAERTVMLTQGFEARSKLDGELKSVKPDNVAYDADGREVSKTYTKPQSEKLKKAREALDKMDKALTKAIQEADFGPLKQVISNKSGGSPTPPVEAPVE